MTGFLVNVFHDWVAIIALGNCLVWCLMNWPLQAKIEAGRLEKIPEGDSSNVFTEPTGHP